MLILLAQDGKKFQSEFNLIIETLKREIDDALPPPTFDV